MDNNTPVLEDERSQPAGDDFRSSPAGVELDEIVPFVPTTMGELEDVIQKFRAMGYPEAVNGAFVNHMLHDPNAWFVSIGSVGMVWMTNVVPGWFGTFNFAFWDKKLTKARREALKTVLATAFERFNLRRVSASAPASKVPVKECLKKIGFVYEGTIREAYVSDPPEDLFVFGMLKKEIPWPLLKMTSSE